MIDAVASTARRGLPCVVHCVELEDREAPIINVNADNKVSD